MRRLVLSLAWEFMHDHFQRLRERLDGYGADYGSWFAAALAVQVGEHLRQHCVSTVYDSWLRWLVPLARPVPLDDFSSSAAKTVTEVVVDLDEVNGAVKMDG
jgi:hypothetical protein